MDERKLAEPIVPIANEITPPDSDIPPEHRVEKLDNGLIKNNNVEVDLKKAKKSCKKCFGTGINGYKKVNEQLIPIVCLCVYKNGGVHIWEQQKVTPKPVTAEGMVVEPGKTQGFTETPGLNPTEFVAEAKGDGDETR